MHLRLRLLTTMWLLSTLLPVFSASPADARQDASLHGVVTEQESGDPIAGATVLEVVAQRSVQTDRRGAYELRLEPGTHTVLIAAAGHGSVEREVVLSAGEGSELPVALPRMLSQFGEELVVLGSRAQRTALETPVPVDVLTREELETSGLTETSRALQLLAPSFNFSTSTISDGTDIVRPSTLRGLGPDQTLVLINGKRRHNSALVHVNGSIGRGTAGVDLNAIPASALERTEILRDGAAAQYGSDAIAGVINLVLRSDTGMTRLRFHLGQYYQGDGDTQQGSVNHGFRLGEQGYLNVTGEFRDRAHTNRAGEDPRQIFNFLEQQYGQPQLASGTLDPREAAYDRLNHRYGDADSENLYLFVNSSLPLSDSAQLYFFGGASARDGRSAGFNRLPSQSRTDVLVFPEGHLPFINTNVDDRSFAVGLLKTFSAWSLDAYAQGGGNRFEYVITNSANTSLGAASPTSANAGRLSLSQELLGLDLFGTVAGTRRPIVVAVGAEVRRDAFRIGAGDVASWIDGGVSDQFGGRAPAGIQVFPGFRPSNAVDASRHNVAVYADFELNPSRSLLVDVAGRYEEYSDFGDTLDGKVALRWEVSSGFAFRGSVSTGFRAPSLHQSYFNNTSTQFVLLGSELVPLEVGTFRNGSAVTDAFGVPPLREEDSVSQSLGLTARPRRYLSITADVFRIDIDDRVVLSGLFQASNPQIAPLLAPFGVNAAQFFTNAINTRTEGVDMLVAYSTKLGASASLDLSGAANWNRTEVVGAVRTPPPLAGLGETLFDRRERAFVERGQPREHYTLSARYHRGRFGAQLRWNKFGSVLTVESPADRGIDQVFASKWLADLDVSFAFSHGVTVAVGASNLFDVFPDKNREEISFNGIFPYPRRNAPFGFNGGYYYTRLAVVF